MAKRQRYNTRGGTPVRAAWYAARGVGSVRNVLVRRSRRAVWRLGVVSYLNTDPLAAALREPSAARFLGAPAEVRAAVPSALLPSLLAGEFDAALVSTAGVLPHADVRILPEMCISSRGEVRSIRLFCRKP